MSLSRRAFVRTLGIGGASAFSTAWVVGHGREALAWGPDPVEEMLQASDDTVMIILSSNENARGPGKAALDALNGRADFKVGRYQRDISREDLPAAIAKSLGHGAQAENILTSTGSSHILEAGVRAYVSVGRPLVTGTPSYGNPARSTRAMGAEVREVPVDSNLRLDLDGMADAAQGAGLVFLCNPNNPTSATNSAENVSAFIEHVVSSSPGTGILVDEAYIDYATDPSVASAIAESLTYPGVFLARTFSKAYGMAGLRLGYAAGQTGTLDKLSRAWGLGEVSLLTASAAIASLNDPSHMEWEREENRKVRDFTINELGEMGFESAESQTNFLFVDIGRSAAEFREACRALGVSVGRDFPPMEKTHARISLGTMEEMQRALEVFRQVLTN
jgi:histidinol-phosphate aminotransferase|tara:strand:+ start:5814 stop:6983 length:1170 start_codon:yes stop_codon:yes gene_type:complete